MTSSDHNDSRKLLQIIGQVDIFEDSTAGDTVISVLTADGDEYVIASRKIVKRLLRYAGEEIDIEFLGYVTHDASDGLDILNVVSFKPTSEEDIRATADADYDRSHGSKKRKRAIADELDDEDMNSEDFDIAVIHDDDLDDLDLDDEDLDLDDEDFDLDDADLDLSILNAIVKEAIGKTTPEPTELAKGARATASPAKEPVATTKKNPDSRHPQNKADQEADVTPNHGQKTKNTKEKTAGRLDKASAEKAPTIANPKAANGKSSAPKKGKDVDVKAPDKAEAKKNAKAMATPKSAKKRKTPPPAAK